VSPLAKGGIKGGESITLPLSLVKGGKEGFFGCGYAAPGYIQLNSFECCLLSINYLSFLILVEFRGVSIVGFLYFLWEY